MATSLATTTDMPKPIAKAPVAAGSKLAAFVPQTLDEAWRLAGALANSGMTPKTYGADQNKIMVGIMAGAEVGLAPFAALQSIAVIGNNPSLWGDGMLGLVEASGLLDDFEEHDDGTVATCRANRKGRATPIVRTFSNDDAKKAGLLGKSGPWSQYPARMRQMRARAFCLRDGFADVLRGLKSAEEVRDYAPMDGGSLSSAAPRLNAAALIEQASAPANDGMLDEQNPAAAEGPADEDRGEFVHPGTALADDLVARYARAAVTVDVSAADRDFATHGEAMLDEDRDRVQTASDAAKRRLGR